MVDPTPGTETTRVLTSSSGTTPPAASVRPFPIANCKLVVGERWHGYQIDGPVADGRPNCFEATDVGQMEKVRITATLLNKGTAIRRAVWEQLRTQLSPDVRIVRCIESHEEEGWRYEVTATPPATSLREWIACHQAEKWVARHLLEQLATTVSALHSVGLVHLSIRPEILYLNGEGNQMEIVLGGFDAAVPYKQAGTTPGEIDPFYAPPESVDAPVQRPGIGLCAWDWWSVGRVIQEVILGRHVMSLLFGCEVIREPDRELCDRARALLLEVEPPGLRAGAVEAMPTLDLSFKVMLRGLLTSARDARWGGEAVRLWLAKEGVSNHYDLARNARFFTWKGYGRTLSEAAQFFRAEENWADGEHHLFDPTDPETLAHFLSTVPEHAADWKKLQEIYGYMQWPELSEVSEGARRTVATAFAWLVFGPQPGALVVKGHRVDPPGLGALLGAGLDAVNSEIVRAFLFAPCQGAAAALDSAAGEMLAQLDAVGGEALRKLQQHGWMAPGEPESLAHVLKISLETEQARRKRAERVRTTYADCQDGTLAQLLKEKNPAPWAQVVLIITSENPRRFGYVTRAEHVRQHIVGLQIHRQQLGVALFWLNLKTMLQVGRPWSGNWRLFWMAWLGLVGFGIVVVRDVATTTWLAASLVALRVYLGLRIGRIVGQCDAAAERWGWRDGPDRCTADAQRMLGGSEVPSVAPVRQRLGEIEKEVAGLVAAGTKTSALLIPSVSPLWPVFAAAFLVSLLGAIQLMKNCSFYVDPNALSIAQSNAREDSPLGLEKGTQPDSPEEIAALLKTLPGLSLAMVEKVKSGEYEIVRDAFGSTLHGPIQKWAFAPPDVVPPLPVESRAPATASQRAFALVSGELLLRPYGKRGATALIVVQVPTRDGFGLMLYNGRSRKLVDHTALTLREGLPDKTWYRLDRFNVIYLGSPPEMEVQNANLVAVNVEPDVEEAIPR